MARDSPACRIPRGGAPRATSHMSTSGHRQAPRPTARQQSRRRTIVGGLGGARSGDFGDQLVDDLAQVRGDLGVLPRVAADRRSCQVWRASRSSTTRTPRDSDRLADLIVRPHAAVPAQRRTDDRDGLVLERPVAVSRDSQSIAFFSTPGMLPLYSGVTTRAASASAPARRNAATGSGDVVSVEVLVVERQLPQPVEQDQRDASGRRLDGHSTSCRLTDAARRLPSSTKTLAVRHVPQPLPIDSVPSSHRATGPWSEFIPA